MKLSEYVAKCRTFVTSTNDDAMRLYFDLGLIEDVGEVAGKFAKFVRRVDDTDFTQLTDADKEAIAKELGDVCWFTAMHIKYPNLVSAEITFQVCKNANAEDIKHVRQILRLMTQLSCNSDSECWSMFYQISILGSIIGYTLDDIMQMNIDKLTDRKKRGVIKGEGDNR